MIWNEQYKLHANVSQKERLLKVDSNRTMLDRTPGFRSLIHRNFGDNARREAGLTELTARP